jgi:hypothetical protein
MTNLRFYGVDIDYREVEVTDQFLELRWSGAYYHRVHYASICSVHYDPQFAHTVVRVRDSQAKNGYIKLEIGWHADHDAQSFAATVDYLLARAAHDAVIQTRLGKPAVGGRDRGRDGQRLCVADPAGHQRSFATE